MMMCLKEEMKVISRGEAKERIRDIVGNDNNIIKTGITLPIKRGQTFNVYRIPFRAPVLGD